MQNGFASDLWGTEGVEGVQDAPDRVTVAPHFGGEFAVAPCSCPPLACVTARHNQLLFRSLHLFIAQVMYAEQQAAMCELHTRQTPKGKYQQGTTRHERQAQWGTGSMDCPSAAPRPGTAEGQSSTVQGEDVMADHSIG